MKRTLLLVRLLLGVSAYAADPWGAPSASQIDGVYARVESLYTDLHRNPELSLHEEKTAAKIAGQLKDLGYQVTTGVGGTGVVAVLRNGAGPVVMIRAEMDALPLLEKTGLAYSSHVLVKGADGVETPVMHACGHDLHMAVGIGTAALLAGNRDRWQGTFVFVGEPAEEVGAGASAMLKDGLFTRFPRPDFVLSVHDTAELPAGKVGYTSGFALANTNSVDVTIYGKGGHGAMPQLAVDPIVIAARTVVAWQTIVSREISPLDPAVITVGSIHGGTKHNIIPDEVHLQLTVRCYKDEVRKHLLASIERIAKAEAAAAGAERPPLVVAKEGIHAAYNDPALTARLAAAAREHLGPANVQELPPGMAGDDFSEYGRAGIPAVMLSLGVVNPQRFEAARKSGEVLPDVHSPFFAPDREASLRTGITAELVAVLEALRR